MSKPVRCCTRTHLLAVLAAASITSTILGAQSAREPATIDRILALRTVSDVELSPDGRWVAYTTTTRDRDANINRSDVWVVATDGGVARRLTRGPRADHAPRWAPDSKWLAFLSDRDSIGRSQVFGIEPSGGEAWRITHSARNVTAYRIAPDGGRIAYIAMDTLPTSDKTLDKLRGHPLVRDSSYANEWSYIWVAPLTDRTATGARRSSPALLDVTSMEWGPDSRQMAFSAKPGTTLRSSGAAAVYVQDDVGAAAKQVTTMPGSESVADWSSDLGLLVYGTGHLLGTYNREIWRVPLDAGAPVSLTDQLDEDAVLVRASALDLLVEASMRTKRGLFRIPLRDGRAAGAPQALSDGRKFYTNFSMARSGDVTAFLAESGSEAPDVHVASLERFEPRRLTTTNPEVASIALGEQRVVSWKSAADGEMIEGILNLPVGYAAGTRVPLLLIIHGGPTGVSSDRFPSTRGAYPIPVFNGLGYATLQPNYRGSAGYGERFRGLNRGDISGRDWIDVNSGVDALIAQGIAQPDKLGMMGWSFGGHHTFWGITRTTRFAAASAGAGANDLISMYSQTDMPEFYQTYLGPRPWEDFKLYEQRSAYRFVKNVTTPLLIQVGEADRRVPAEQSIQFYEAMKGLGRAPVELVLYPGQPHGISDPRLSHDLMARNVEWFTRWIPVNGAASRASSSLPPKRR
ncbi:MAG: S9 family peptidase [Gemmatimonadota bacterium]